MRLNNKVRWRNLVFVSLLAFSLFQVTAAHPLVDSKQDKSDKRAPVAQTAPTKGQVKQASQKKLRALSLVEGIIATADRITPVEYSILVQVESATLLWQIDQLRALSIIKNTFKTMRESLWDEKDSRPTKPSGESRRGRLWFSIIRKIAALKPELVQELLQETLPADKSRQAILGEWTEEARAVISVASEQIEKDPKLAARIAQQSMPLGFVDWVTFLESLARRDRNEAERLAITLMDRLRDSTITPLALTNLKRFVFAPDQSSNLKEHFFQSLATRLRRDISFGTPVGELEDGLSAARGMGQLAATYSSSWQQQFDNISYQFEGSFDARSLPVPGYPRRVTMDISSVSAASADKTQEIADALPRVGAMKDSQSRDKEYQKLAANAALKADVKLAEEILSKINIEEIRKQSTLLAYGPLIRKAIAESDWLNAKELASKILVPLGRTLTLQRIAQAMSQAGENKSSSAEVYTVAMSLLDREDPTEKVAKAYLILARSLYSIDRERGLESVKSSIWVLNKLANSRELTAESMTDASVASWVSLPSHQVKADEILDLSEMIGTTFREIARHDTENALSVALGLNHRGLQSLAQLAISSVLLNEANNATGAARQGKAAPR